MDVLSTDLIILDPTIKSNVNVTSNSSLFKKIQILFENIIENRKKMDSYLE